MQGKTKRYWLSKLNKFATQRNENVEEVLDRLDSIFQKLAFASKEEWSDKKGSIPKLVSLYPHTPLNGNFIHLETDKTDDTTGVCPKTIKRAITMFGWEYMEQILLATQISAQYFPSSIDPDGFYPWDHKLSVDFPDENWEKDAFQKQKSEDNAKLGCMLYFLTKIRLVPFNGGMYSSEIVISKDKSLTEEENHNFFNLLAQNPLVLMFVGANKELRSHLIEDKYLTPKALFTILKERKVLWHKKHNVEPKSTMMLFVDPDKFSTKILTVVEKIFGSKQIHKLSYIDQWKACSLIDLYGSKLLSLPENVLVRAYPISHILGCHKISEKQIDAVYNNLNQINIPIDMASLALYATKFKNMSAEMIEKLCKLEDKELLPLYLHIIQNNTLGDDFIKFVVSLPISCIATLKRYYGAANSVVRALSFSYTTWNNRSRNQDIPVITGSVENYSYKVIDKTSDPLGLFLGYFTDCCQAYNGAGQSCVTAGSSLPEHGFFAVFKNNKVIAQSYIYTKIAKNDKKILVFDSIEMLNRQDNEDRTRKILECYFEASKELFNQYDGIYIGASGNNIPQSLRDCNELEFYSHDTAMDKGIILTTGVYTDTRNGVYKIKKVKK